MEMVEKPSIDRLSEESFRSTRDRNEREFIFSLARSGSRDPETIPRGGQTRRSVGISQGNANEWNGLIGKYQIHDIESVSISRVPV